MTTSTDELYEEMINTAADIMQIRLYHGDYHDVSWVCADIAAARLRLESLGRQKPLAPKKTELDEIGMHLHRAEGFFAEANRLLTVYKKDPEIEEELMSRDADSDDPQNGSEVEIHEKINSGGYELHLADEKFLNNDSWEPLFQEGKFANEQRE